MIEKSHSGKFRWFSDLLPRQQKTRSVPKNVRGLCHRRVFIPTRHCTSLGAAIYLLLYDRPIKRHAKGLETALPITQVLAEPRSWPENNPVFERRIRR